MRLLDATTLPRFVASDDGPRQVVRVRLAGRGTGTVRVRGDGVTGAAAVTLADGGEQAVEVPVTVGAGLSAGHRADATVILEAGGDDQRPELPLAFEVAEPGWRMFMVAHFHYDPVWWNTQAFYTETWEKLPREERPWEGRRQQPAFTLIDAHLDMARRDPDYRFVLAELDYLKPYWDTFPWRRDELRQLLADGRLELMGGTYNEPNTNLTSAESTARNAVYGIGYQRDVLGGDPGSAWQLDAFGHDPQFPGMMAAAGLTSSSCARGPFHQWGPSRSPGGNASMQFSSEFDWVAPSGVGLLTSYMANHYSAGWELDHATDLEHAMDEADRLFRELAQVAATRNVLLPVGSDYTPPNRWMTEIARAWNARYVWPRFQVALPREFFAAVRQELASGVGPSPQTRDMNPIYTGKDVSYIDTKQAQRAGENRVLAAERFGTVAALLGARYPAEALDKAWRQLLYGAHHDGITGTESDQVYLDLLGGWRDTYELAGEALDDALDHIGSCIDTRGEGQPLVVFNPLGWTRRDPVTARVSLHRPARGLRVLDDAGEDVPFVVEAIDRSSDGHLRACTLTLLADAVPSLGYRTYRLVPAPDLPPDAQWSRDDGLVITNDVLQVTVDPRRGGAISSLRDLRDGTEVLRPQGLANEILAYREYPTHPEHGEGPWHLTPTGEVTASSERPAQVVREHSAVGQRLVVRGGIAGCDLVQTMTLHPGVDRLCCRTDLDGFADQDVLLRMRVAADVPGGLPLSEVGNAVVGRGAGFPAIDVADSPYTLDNPAYNWFGVGTTAAVDLVDDDAPPASRAIAVAEVVAPDHDGQSEGVRDLVVALVRRGVTSTVSRGDGPRYGSMDTDSNLPDVRFAVGGPQDNAFVAQLLAAADPAYAARLKQQLHDRGRARLWVPAATPLREVWSPDADLRGVRDLPVLVVAGVDPRATHLELAEVTTQLAGTARVTVPQPAALHADEGTAADRTVVVVNRGLPGCNVDVDGSLYLSLMRSCSGWPSGVWLDPPRRTVPDGSSFQFQHWTHRFEYAIAAGAGDWRDLGLVRAAAQHNEPLLARTTGVHDGGLPAAQAFLLVEGDDVVVTTLKPAGNPMAVMADPRMDPTHAITVRAYESNGRGGRASVALFRPIRSAQTADLLEVPLTGAEVVDGALVHDFSPYEIATFRLATDPLPAASGPQLGRRREPAQPVFGDYWLHNKGAAPIGYQPVTVRIVDRAVLADGPFELDVVVASQRTDAEVAGMVELRPPDGWEASPPQRSFHLAPGAHDVFRVRVEPAAHAAPGRWFVAARIGDDAGQVHEDVLTVDLGHRSRAPADGQARVLYLERSTRKAAIVEQPTDVDRVAAIGGELTAEVLTERVHATEGHPGELLVDLHNHVAGDVRGEVQVVSPWGTWDELGPWTTGFAVAGGGRSTVRFTLTCPVGASGVTSWALVKVMYFGRVLYTRSVPVVFGPREGDEAGDR
ncbi:glycoside hydrolase family 38 C-terminal domain-containing protein [Egicoccus sp. AB-alg6-2]|uniref:glycoside hydrolase family 38 N-terminal domain-containing protein n=1 Tax=Egicoccus sp. AB-alg6-2 TaxID=3242692 RepID=UPI00359EE3C2